MDLNVHLKEMRKRNGLTQDMIADYLGVDQSYITKIESGERSLTTDILSKLSALYGCDARQLMVEKCDVKPLKLAFRTKKIPEGTLKTLATVNRIALNLRDLELLLEEPGSEK